MQRRTLLIGGGAAALATMAAATALVLRPHRLEPAQVFTQNGLAIGGTDPVAYFTQGAPVAGDARWTHDWAGATWRFADAANRDAFAADPAAYAPRYGGFCAWAVAAKGELYSTQPENWSIRDGRLYLNFDDAVQKAWSADPDGFIREADERWPQIAATE